MKKQDVTKKHLQVSRETIRALDGSRLTEIAGGRSNNGCTAGTTSMAGSICLVCRF